MNGTEKPQILSRPRARKEAAKMLAVALSARYRRLLEASGENETVVATADLAQCMYENIEFVIWALKAQGGLNPPPPDELKPVSKRADELPGQPNHVFAKPPEPEFMKDEDSGLVFGGAVCTCPPLEHGIIGRDKHMVSCPKFVP